MRLVVAIDDQLRNPRFEIVLTSIEGEQQRIRRFYRIG